MPPFAAAVHSIIFVIASEVSGAAAALSNARARPTVRLLLIKQELIASAQKMRDRLSGPRERVLRRRSGGRNVIRLFSPFVAAAAAKISSAVRTRKNSPADRD